jgi:hypothetical protein
MKKTTSKKIINYGAMSAAILGAANVAGQVVYTDVEPDEVIGLNGSFNIDLNADGIADFNPQVFDGGVNGAGAVIFPTSSGSNSNQGSNGNGFVGFLNSNYNYPSNLSSGAVIDANAAFRTDVRGDLNFYSCNYSGSQFCDGVTDGFIGVSFELAGNTHYGWIRVDVSADASLITVKDFAFDATPDAAIVAGDNALSLEDNTIDGFSSYVDANNILQLDARVPLNNISIFNVTGQEVVSKSLSNNSESIDINALSTGVYIARVAVAGTETAIKFVKR